MNTGDYVPRAVGSSVRLALWIGSLISLVLLLASVALRGWS